MKEQTLTNDQQLVAVRENFPSKDTKLTGRFLYESSEGKSLDISYENSIKTLELRPSKTVKHENVEVRAVNVDYTINDINIRKSEIGAEASAHPQNFLVQMWEYYFSPPSTELAISNNADSTALTIPNEQDNYFIETTARISGSNNFDLAIAGREGNMGTKIFARNGDTIKHVLSSVNLNNDQVHTFLDIIQQYNDAEQNIEVFAQQAHNSVQTELSNKYPILQAVQPVHELEDKKTHSVSEAILSRTYSIDADNTAAFFTNSIEQLVSDTDTRDYVLFLALNIAKGASFPTVTTTSFGLDSLYYYSLVTSGPLRFIDDIENSINIDDAPSSEVGEIMEVGGFYTTKHNIVVIKNQQNYVMAHEMTHASMAVAFGSVNLYYENSNDGPVEQDFASVATEIVKSVSKKLGIDCSSISELKENAVAQDFYNDPESMSNSLGINHDEAKVIQSILTTAFAYAPGDFNAELPARMVDLHANGVSADSIAMYFHSLEKYLQEHFISKVHGLIAEHKEYCHQVVDSENESDNQDTAGNFQFCLSEVLEY